jgi:glycosyltransferase involved in cell wall biosynthesis
MTGAPERATAVSLTPVSLDADSRAYRVARSLAETGFRSVVVEGQPSARRFWDKAIEVRSALRPSRAPVGVPRHRTRFHRAIAAMRDGRLGMAAELALYVGFRGYDWWRHCYRPRRLLPRAALYYVHSFELYRAVAPVAARLGARVIYDAHDFYRGIDPSALLRSFDRNRLRPFLDRLEDRFAADADAVVTVSEGVADLMEGSFGRRPVVLRNCHDERLDSPVAPDLRNGLGLSAEDRLCVVVGNWKRGMAVEVAADALALLPERFHLAFLGRGYEAVADKLGRHPARWRLHLGRFAAPNAIVPAIRSADLGLVLYEPHSENYRYALPNGFFQTVAAGLPVIRAPLPEIEATIAGRAVGACLTEVKPAALARAIVGCAADAAALRPNVAALASELRWEVEAVRLRQAIESVIARPAAPARAALGASGQKPFLAS